MSKETNDLVMRAVTGRTVNVSFQELLDPDPAKRPKLGPMFGIGTREPKPVETPADPELVAAEAAINGAAALLEPQDLEKLRTADRETKLRFAKNRQRQLERNAAEAHEAKSKTDAAAEEVAAKERNRLALLGRDVGRWERNE